MTDRQVSILPVDDNDVVLLTQLERVLADALHVGLLPLLLELLDPLELFVFFLEELLEILDETLLLVEWIVCDDHRAHRRKHLEVVAEQGLDAGLGLE